MRVLVYDDAQTMSRAAATIIANEILSKENPVLGLATGSSPIETYKCLVEMYKDSVISFKNVRSFNLDEYVGLPIEHEESYHSFMKRNLFDHVDIEADAFHVPSGNTSDPTVEGHKYDQMIIESGGIDLQLLGLGQNGHIGFNEPDTSFSRGTHLVNLSENTIEANSRFFSSIDEVPKQAISMGILSIMNAKKILLIATGKNKSEAVKKMLEGEIDPSCPASILQTHKDVVVLLDREAASLLSE